MNFEDLTFLFNCSLNNRGMIRMDLDEAACLYRNLKSLKYQRLGVEIGRAAGGSTILILSAFVGDLISIDVNDKNNERLLKKFHELNFQNIVTLVSKKSNEYELTEKIDFVFIDGDHTYEEAKYDYDYYGSKVRSEGLIIFHDMGNARDNAAFDIRLMKLWKELIRDKNIELIEEVGSVCVFKKL